MKYLFINLKRFDAPREIGGVNDGAVDGYGKRIIEGVQKPAADYRNTIFAVFLPEAHIPGAKAALNMDSNLALGCQGVHFSNIKKGGNFGAFTTSLPAAAATALGCKWTIIGHCEERNKLNEILKEGDCSDPSAINRTLGKSIKCAMESGLNILYCVGESDTEQPMREQVLANQLAPALPYAGTGRLVIAYEPVWAIGPGKTPPEAGYITDIARYIKSIINCPVVYGGGLKSDNAAMLAGIREIDGGLIALTRFTGNIGFYSDEYLEIVQKYLEGCK